MSQAVNRARKGDGPTLIEAKTYRIRGHFEGDPCDYRPAQELEMWKLKDPFVRYQNQLKDMKIITINIATKNIPQDSRENIYICLFVLVWGKPRLCLPSLYFAGRSSV